MGSIRVRDGSNRLFFDFRYHGIRFREQTLLEDSPNNRKKLEMILKKIEAEILLGTFNYPDYFPDSPNINKLVRSCVGGVQNSFSGTSITFDSFAKIWLLEMAPLWRESHRKGVESIVKTILIPYFGDHEMIAISKAGILAFRSVLVTGEVSNRGKPLSASRVNHIMTPLRMILNEAADRFEFTSPWQNIKPLKVPKTDVHPFTIDEVNLILREVRADYRNYYCVRFLTALRTGEVDGLPWRNIDFDRRQILIKQAVVERKIVPVKTDGSFRVVDMSEPVYEALLDQRKATGQFEYVFCNAAGNPLEHNHVTKRVWHPLLKYLDLERRRPYQTRHTTATLWLASGESPEWIARQMGHSSTEMLFKVYSRYVPNLTRKDGSAFAALLEKKMSGKHTGDNTNDQ